ncbi:MAG: chitobiase/beta-hexosaminidase C-terminal domain-containing protein, partial [Caldilineaceae bacterium]|nr:chitobiase/beta-hexosaminidase C-terminal domain-containing protein [Caldilineaceae bacterium]
PTARRYLDGTSVDYPPQQPARSFGRTPAGDFVRYDTATPGAPNDAAGTPVTLATVTFSHARGLYDAPFALTLRTDDRTAAIRYTLDGSAPTGTHGTLYAEPIAIAGTAVVRAVAVAPTAAPGPVATQTYIFPAAVMRQPAAPPGAPATWGTHQIDFGGYRAGDAVQADYA